MEGKAVKVIFITKGRVTGKPHSVMLRAVKYRGKFYLSRHRPDGDWFQNAIANPDIEIEIDGAKVKGKAKRVVNEKLIEKISELKYPEEKRAKEKRVAVEVTLYE